MAETGRTDSVFWPVGSGRTADLGKEAGKQRDGGSGSVLEYWNRQPQRYRAVLWKAEKREAGADAGTPGRIPAADRSLTWYFQSDSGLSYLRRGQSECRTQKEGANADTVLRLVTWREKGAITGQSLYANVNIPGGGFEEAQTLRTKMQNVLDETMESKRSSVAVQGFYLGNLSEEKKEAIAEQLLEDMHARTVIKNQDGNLYTVYAYSPCFSESVRQGTTRVNLALTMYYNSRTQQTEICAAVPAIGVSGESA